MSNAQIIEESQLLLEKYKAISPDNPLDRQTVLTEIEQNLSQLPEIVTSPVSKEDFIALESLAKTIRGERFYNFNYEMLHDLLLNDIASPLLDYYRAHAALELSHFQEASEILKNIIDKDVDEFLISEVNGALGRIDKQKYINNLEDVSSQQKQDFIKNAILIYGVEYAKADTIDKIGAAYYHGANFIALVWRAEHDKIDISDILLKTCPEHKTASDIARELLADLYPYAQNQIGVLAEGQFRDIWAIASCGEAILALELSGEDLEGFRPSEYWFLKYAEYVSDPFTLLGTIRQLDEVWLRTSNSDIGGVGFSFLKNRTFALGGSVDLNTTDLERLKSLKNQESNQFENIQDSTGSFEALMKEAPRDIIIFFKYFARAQSIGRVKSKISKLTIGTGFLIPGEYLGKKYKNEILFITNAHVVSNNKIDRNIPGNDEGALHPDTVCIEFGRFIVTGSTDLSHNIIENDVTIFSCKEILWTSSHQDLDATILRLELKRGEELPPALEIMPFDLVGKTDGDLRTALIIGYPKGGNLHFSDRDNGIRTLPKANNDDPDILAFGWQNKDRPEWEYVHYSASTEGGSSGSPVFSDDVEAVYAIHHRSVFAERNSANKEKKNKKQIKMLNGRVSVVDSVVTWKANQGVLLKSILTQAKKDLAKQSGWFFYR